MTLITKQGFCPGCMMTQHVLDAMNVKYTVKHLTNETDKQHVRDLGIQQYPIVEPNDKMDKDVFWGFHPDKLKAYK